MARFEAELFPAVDALGVNYEVIAVDDGSSDGTGAALETLAKNKPVRVLHFEKNRGLGAALRAGFGAANGEWVAALDADLTFHPRYLADLLACQKKTGADLVAGSPFLESSSATAVPWSRRLPSLMLNAFYRGLFIHGFSAYTPMFRLYRRHALSGLHLESEGFEISAEIAGRFVQKRLKLAEVPVPLTTRTEGASKLARARELKRHAALVWRLLTTKP